MLLANMKVAEFIHQAFPNNALLRRHEEPKGKKRGDFLAKCEELGVEVDMTTSKTFYESLKSLPQRYDMPYILEVGF
jgi:DIS3-like exonuclease 2